MWSPWELGWPWVCLGGGLALSAVMFASDAMRCDLSVSRWRDPVWLAWLAVPMLMLHMFEEYGMDMLGRNYIFPQIACATLGYPPFPECPIPRAHFPLLNMGIAWVTAPIAACFARRNLVIGLSWYGLTIVNSGFHIGELLVNGPPGAAGVLTASFFYVPSFIWMVHVVRQSGLSVRSLAAALSLGVIAHLMLVAAFIGFVAGWYGTTVMLGLDVATISFPIWGGLIASRFVATP